MSIEKYLVQGAGGGNLLFCGAGFSADCLNFGKVEVGAASPLLKALNDTLGYEYTDLQLAADDYLQAHGEHGLLALLAEKYSVATRTPEINQILSYPWSRVYTTNYDDVISQSLTELKVDHYVANNLERPENIERLATSKKWVVHLHGSLRSWDINNFQSSCVLGRESYLKISKNSNWSPTLREDYAKASAVFFVGFSNSDFYLAEQLFNATSSKDKVFFINRESSVDDRELKGKQRGFGHSVAIGKARFAQLISDALKSSRNRVFVPRSFKKVKVPDPAEERASVPQQEQFMIYGQSDMALLQRDLLDASKSYRAPRECVSEICDFLKKNVRIALIVGGICSGKSQIFEEAILRIVSSGRQVFRLTSKYQGIFDEVRRIVDEYPGAVLAIDDCFSLREQLRDIVRYAASADSSLLLASRTIAYDSEGDLREQLTAGTELRVFDTEILTDSEVEALIDCTDRVGGWGTDVSSHAQKVRNIAELNAGRLSGFLLSRFRSKHIRDRFVSELDIFRTAGPAAIKVLILALYLRHIGEKAQENFLSEMAGEDALSVLKPHLKNTPFISFDPTTNSFETIASVNARDVLSEMFTPREVTLVVVEALKQIAPARSQHAFRRLFAELMRYTQLKQVVSNKEEQDFFFDRLSELSFCRSHVLFWLQWSMCMRDNSEFVRARQYLDEAYGMSMNWDGFDTHHLDDQRAGLLLDSAKAADSSANYFRTAQEAFRLLTRLTARTEQTSHPYQTIQSFDGFMEKALPQLSQPHKTVLASLARALRAQIGKRLADQHEGYIKRTMENANTSLDAIIANG